ncbi:MULTISPECIES: glycosyltransferase family 4 protein [unclassified Enterococcus]|uniref:glycosyltransferase family 4 protein n=1 Tax=unclassified Enterococcus TaxID=2608891 RepID=UPI0013ED6141|nr:MULTISPECIES: glycosyltransferase family 4 protein [unclassified Enterococcus]
MKIKKILFVATVVKTHINTFHLNNIKIFKDLGYEVHVAAKNDFDPKNSLDIPNCDVYHDINFPRNPFSPNLVKAYIELKKVIKKTNFDIIHCNTPVGGLLTRFAAAKLRKKGTKILYQAHGFHFFKGAPIKNWLLFYPIEKYLSRYTDFLLVINKEDYDRCKTFRSKQIRLVNGVGVDIDKFHCATGNFKERYSLPEELIVLTSIGELNKNKNHIAVIESLGRIVKEINSPFLYVICGEGKQRKKLEQRIKELSLEKNVLLLGYTKEIPSILSDTDLFLFPSYREGLPVSVMEAMCVGTPIVASNIRGNRDLITNKQNGELFDVRNTEELDEILKRFFSGKLPVETYSKNAYESIQHFSKERVAHQMSEVYEVLASGSEM